MSVLNAFTTQLMNFFEELCTTFPEEKDIRMAYEAIKGTKKINPRLLLDLFNEHVYRGCADAIYRKDAHSIREFAQQKFSNEFNEMLYALSIFDRQWDTMTESNQKVIWQYLNVLCKLSEKA